MNRKQFSVGLIIGVLNEAGAGAAVSGLCRRHGISSATYDAWIANFGRLEASDTKRLQALEEVNARCKRLLADTMLDTSVLSLAMG